MQQNQLKEPLRKEDAKRGCVLQVHTQYENLPAKTQVKVVRIVNIRDVPFVRVTCGLNHEAKSIMKTIPLTALEASQEPRRYKGLAERNKQIVKEVIAGLPLTEIAIRHGVTKRRVKDIVQDAEQYAKDITRLKGSQTLPTEARNLLLRMNYKSISEVQQDIAKGKLRLGCTTRLGEKHFAIIYNWALQDADKSIAA